MNLSGNDVRELPNTTTWREPGILTDYDNNTVNIVNAGFAEGTTTEEFARALVKDYNDMILSLEKYHGFYIGRYELSTVEGNNEKGQEKKGGTSGGQNWYASYKQAKDIIPKEAEGKVLTRMIWGLQWDATCKWIVTNTEEQKSIQNSRAWGNYSDSIEKAATNSGGSAPKTTGTSDFWKANNIYDLAGNCWEWTQEVNDTYDRAIRGGAYGNSGTDVPVTSRINGISYFSYTHSSSRSTLYVK